MIRLKSKISMVDYIGCYSVDAGPVGHSLKVINDCLEEYADDLELEVLAPEVYLPSIKTSNKKPLPYYTDAENSGSSVWSNIIAMLKSFRNIRCALRQASNEVVWFYNVNQFLFMYLFLAGIQKKRLQDKKIMVTLFAREYPKGYHNYCLKKVLPHLSLVISSNPEFDREQCKSIYMPDYLYDAKVYDKYCANKKENKVVCLGTMNPSKRILELVSAFSQSDISLEIYGLFYDQNYYQQVLNCCSSNVKIENRYLEYEEYLTILGGARYCVLPYSMTAYSNFTSGVLLECMYVDTVPISDDKLLSKMGVQGIGYRQIEELSRFQPEQELWQNARSQNKKMVEEQYSVTTFHKQIIGAVENLRKETL